MPLPLFLDRPLRRFLKLLPTPRKSLPRLSFIVLLLLTFLFYNRQTTITITHPLTRTQTTGTTTLTPCQPHPCTSPLTPTQALNLLATLSTTSYLHISTTCNTTAPHVPPSSNRAYTTATSILLPREAFLLSGGFDERLPEPLLPTLLPRLTLPHIRLTPQFAESIAVSHLPPTPWQPSVYKISAHDPLSLTLRSAPNLHQFDQRFLQTVRKRALHDVHHLPWDLLHRLPSTILHPLIHDLDGGKTLLLIHVAHGLGNRLRALGSSLAFARATNRVPVLVWPPDAHCAVRFDQLFDSDLPVITDLPGYPFEHAGFYDTAWRRWRVYNYMPGEGGVKDELIQGKGHVYYKGAYVMRTPLTSWDAANEHLRALVPVSSIRERVARVAHRLENSIGVHVRHLSTDKDIGGVDPVGEYGDFDTRVIGYFRSACSPRVFIDELRKVKRDTALKEVFIATDSPQWRQEIGGEIDGVWGMGGCQGRCEIDAMVDLLSLVKCPVVLGSFWSSFSEAVQRFSGRKIRLAGVDFGRGGEGFGSDVEDFARKILEKRRAAGN